jgi:hypothetical protein
MIQGARNSHNGRTDPPGSGHIDCDACVEACPVDACFAEDQLPEEWQQYTQINAGYYKRR